MIKRNEMLTRATARINLEDVMLSEIKQTQKDFPHKRLLHDIEEGGRSKGRYWPGKMGHVK